MMSNSSNPNFSTIDRLRRQQETLLSMAKLSRDLPQQTIFESLTKKAAQALSVSQVGIWLFDEERTKLSSLVVYQLETNQFLPATELHRSDFPLYFSALDQEKSIAANDALTDERTREFTEPYLKPNHIYSLLDSPILVSGENRGVICCEHKFETRNWEHDEILFSSGIADQVAQILMAQDKKIVESKLHQAEKLQALGELAGGIAHDFNNQLTGIIGFSELLKAKLKDQDLLGYANNILKMAENATHIIKQMLAFARKAQIRYEPIDVHAITNEVIQMLTHTFDRKIILKKHLHASASVILGDTSLLQNVLLNIAINARDAMPDGGEISISTENVTATEIIKYLRNDLSPAEIYIKMSIADTGTGIEPAVLKHIFEPFFTTKKEGAGTGMGLSAAYGAIKHLGGTLNVESELGQGATFIMYLPAEHSCPMPEAFASDPQILALSDTSHDKQSKIILIIDDEPYICTVIEEVVQSMGYATRVFSASREAVSFYQAHASEIVLVISDINMPDMNGYEVFQALRQIQPAVKVIMSSGHNDIASAEELLKLGATDYIAKPYRIANLMKIIQNSLSDDSTAHTTSN